MFEIFGRTEKRFDIEKLKKIHKVNGIIYFLIFAFIAYFCMRFIILSKTELSARSAFHSIFALTILVLFGVKISITRIYRQFYHQVTVFGLIIAITTFGLVGTSGGYYLLVTRFGTDMAFDKIVQYKQREERKKAEAKDAALRLVIRTDPESIGSGKNLFDAKCSFCHDAYSTNTIVGPGLKGVLKKPSLPVSGRSATPENIIKQLRQPFSRMPSFEYLSEKEIADILAFLNTI
jgi:mono/diheme cytochrome c family protein